MCNEMSGVSDVISKAAGDSCSIAQTHAHHDAAAGCDDQANDNVEKCDSPKGKKVERLSTV